MYGTVRVNVELERVREVLLKEGFREPLLQLRREGQVFGMVKELSDTLEVHVRAYADGSLDAEVEVSRRFLEHLTAGSEPAPELLAGVLRRHGIECEVTRHPAGEVHAPVTLTPWKPLAAVAALLLLPLILRRGMKGSGDGT